MKVRANGIELEVEDNGDPSKPAVLFIMGLGTQLTGWPRSLVDGVVAAGYRAILFDNRDIGLSQFFDALGDPNLAWLLVRRRLGFRPRPLYSLSDMAADSLGVLDALQVKRAHVVGVSMGGMIGQRVAIAAPDRVASLTSIMSSSGAAGLPGPDKAVVRLLLSRPLSKDRDAVVAHEVTRWKLLQGSRFPTPDEPLRTRSGAAFDRSFHPRGANRQLQAIVCDDSRAAALAQVKVPTLVIHGTDDRLIPHACGEDTARRIAGAKMVSIEGMGHDLPEGVVGRLLAELLPHIK